MNIPEFASVTFSTLFLWSHSQVFPIPLNFPREILVIDGKFKENFVLKFSGEQFFESFFFFLEKPLEILTKTQLFQMIYCEQVKIHRKWMEKR